MFNYTEEKIRLGTVWGRLDPPVELPLVLGDCAYVARGG